MWRLRVGDWRVLFEVDFGTRTVLVLDVRNRGDAYRP
jgi:mRNA-degrading endonuclease RelE of RelBE toxin-antitoxin system